MDRFHWAGSTGLKPRPRNAVVAGIAGVRVGLVNWSGARVELEEVLSRMCLEAEPLKRLYWI